MATPDFDIAAAATPLAFTHVPHSAPMAADARAAVLANPGFGTTFSDHMVSIRWNETQGWHEAEVRPYGAIALDPAAAVLHYAQEIFEGLKAYRSADGGIALFRPEANAARFNASAQRLAMPGMPEYMFVDAVTQLVQADSAWFPTVEGGSLYLRPFMFASEAFLGVRPSREYRFLVIASPAGNYFKSGAPAVSLWVSDYSRAAPGGTGAAKCGGNYASSLVPTAEAFARGHDQVLFLDAVERQWIEELGGMNLFFVFADGSLLTPPLGGTILPGITRESLIQLARDEGLAVREERYSLEQWRVDATSGAVTETFACGTAAVVTPVGQVTSATMSFSVGSGGPGQVTQKLRDRLVAIQRGTAPDPYGWVRRVV
jgi:branched-chain amino acid aminotransferase